MRQKNKELIMYTLTGVAAGLVNGFFGAGGGLLIVPMLSFVLKQDSKVIHATTLACVLCMCFSAGAVYVWNKVYNFNYIIPCVIGGSLGGILGTFFLKKLKNNVVDLIFNFVLIIAGMLMIIF